MLWELSRSLAIRANALSTEQHGHSHCINFIKQNELPIQKCSLQPIVVLVLLSLLLGCKKFKLTICICFSSIFVKSVFETSDGYIFSFNTFWLVDPWIRIISDIIWNACYKNCVICTFCIVIILQNLSTCQYMKYLTLWYNVWCNTL